MKKNLFIFFISFLCAIYISLTNEGQFSSDDIIWTCTICLFCMAPIPLLLSFINPYLLKFNVYGNFNKYKDLQHKRYIQNFERIKNKIYKRNNNQFDKDDLKEIEHIHDKLYSNYLLRVSNYLDVEYDVFVGFITFLYISFITIFVFSINYISVDNRLGILEIITPYSKNEIFEYINNYEEKRADFINNYLNDKDGIELENIINEEMIITTNDSNIRKGPSTKYKILSSLNKNSKILVLGKVENKNWYQVLTKKNERAYIHRSLLKGIK